MEHWTSRWPCLTVMNSMCRGDLSSRALAHSWAEVVQTASTVATVIGRVGFMPGICARPGLFSRGFFCALNHGFHGFPLLRAKQPWDKAFRAGRQQRGIRRISQEGLTEQ